MASTKKQFCRLHFILFDHTIWISPLRIDFSGARAKVPSSESPPPPSTTQSGSAGGDSRFPELSGRHQGHSSVSLFTSRLQHGRDYRSVRGTGFAQPSSLDGQSQKLVVFTPV